MIGVVGGVGVVEFVGVVGIVGVVGVVGVAMIPSMYSSSCTYFYFTLWTMVTIEIRVYTKHSPPTFLPALHTCYTNQCSTDVGSTDYPHLHSVEPA